MRPRPLVTAAAVGAAMLLVGWWGRPDAGPPLAPGGDAPPGSPAPATEPTPASGPPPRGDGPSPPRASPASPTSQPAAHPRPVPSGPAADDGLLGLSTRCASTPAFAAAMATWSDRCAPTLAAEGCLPPIPLAHASPGRGRSLGAVEHVASGCGVDLDVVCAEMPCRAQLDLATISALRTCPAFQDVWDVPWPVGWGVDAAATVDGWLGGGWTPSLPLVAESYPGAPAFGAAMAQRAAVSGRVAWRASRVEGPDDAVACPLQHPVEPPGSCEDLRQQWGCDLQPLPPALDPADVLAEQSMARTRAAAFLDREGLADLPWTLDCTDVPCVLAVWLPEGRRPASGHGLNPTGRTAIRPRRTDGSVVWSFPIHDAETWTRPGFADRHALRGGLRSVLAEQALGWTLPR